MADPLQIHRASAPPAQVEGNNQETTDAGHAVASISSLVSRCFRDFQDLLDELSTLDEHSQANSKVSEGLGRLRVWAGNFGAHRKQTDRLSLDHRLREAPELHRGVRSHLNGISETIKEGMTPRVAVVGLATQPIFSKRLSFKKPRIYERRRYDRRRGFGFRDLRLGWVLGADQNRGVASIAR
jgi:hypothetical protein